jgi:hypothetical protein
MPPQNQNFETARTRKFRESSLAKEDERTISHIEEFGCSVVNVARTNHGVGWSYTIGIFDTSGKPEILTVGLPPETAHSALNEAAKRLRAGVDLTQGRHRDLVGEVDCEFRPVGQKWLRQLMGWAIWYYKGDDFPVLQAVYPDRKNRFPEDEGFDKGFEQPLMQPTAPMTQAENDFGPPLIRKAVCTTGNFQTIRIRESFFPKRSTKELSLSHSFHTTPMMAPGSSWVTV